MLARGIGTIHDLASLATQIGSPVTHEPTSALVLVYARNLLLSQSFMYLTGRYCTPVQIVCPFLGRAWLPEHPARSPLRRPELLTYTHHTTSSALGAQKFPSAASSRDQLVQCQVRHCSLQAPVLALELLQAPCLAHLHPAVLPPPPVVRLLGDAQLPADQLHGICRGPDPPLPPAVQ